MTVKKKSDPSKRSQTTKKEEPVEAVESVEPAANIDSAVIDGGQVSMLSGNFQASCTSFLSNLSLMDVPGYYKIVNVNSAVLVEHALLEFKYYPLNINIPMVRKTREEKQIKVLLSVGGENGRFDLLNGSAHEDNFFNSLKTLYLGWGFDGVTFDIRQLDKNNRPYIISAVKRFHEDEKCKEAFISIAARATFVCPAADGIYGNYNQLVPLINELCPQNEEKSMIDLIQIMEYGYGSDYDKLTNGPKTSPPTPPPPVGDKKKMLEYIFSSYINPFDFTGSKQDGKNRGGDKEVKGYRGFDSTKVMMGVVCCEDPGPQYYVPPVGIKEVIGTLNEKYSNGIGGVMVEDINNDARDNYEFSQGITGSDGK